MKFVNPMNDTPEGKLLAIVRDIEKSLGIEKNSEAMGCGDKEDEEVKPDYLDMDKDGNKKGSMKEAIKDSKKGNKKIKKADMSEKDKYCMKKFGKKYSECSAEQKAQCDKECGDVKKSDATSDFLQKYFQEKSGDDVKPMYVEISGETEIPAHGPHYNQLLPYTEDGPKKSITSETYSMPSVYKTGYDVNGSSLHMKLNDGGTGGSMYRDKVEEALATIKKEATTGQLGLVQEIAGQIEQIYSRL